MHTAALHREFQNDAKSFGWETVRQLGAGSHGRCFLMKRPDGAGSRKVATPAWM